jgi:hypothetical protein
METGIVLVVIVLFSSRASLRHPGAQRAQTGRDALSTGLPAPLTDVR